MRADETSWPYNNPGGDEPDWAAGDGHPSWPANGNGQDWTAGDDSWPANGDGQDWTAGDDNWPVNGNGPASDGFNPSPANFVDPGTIAQLQESYLFWRIKKGGVGLPVEGHPWKSVMPRWEVELSDDMIWKIIMAEYAGSGHKPRTWE